MKKDIINFYCKVCKKDYASYQSLWIHNKKFHKNPTSFLTQNTSILTQNTSILTQNTSILPQKNSCVHCKKILSRHDNLKRHEKTCKKKTNDISQTELIKNTVREILSQAKIHPKTLQKINNQINNNNNGTVNNINNTFVRFGSEDLTKILSDTHMHKILNRCHMALEESIKTVHFNKEFPEYSNVFITNLKDTTAYIFNGDKFIVTSKDYVIYQLFEMHKVNIEDFIECNPNLEQFDLRKQKKIFNFIEEINNKNKKYTKYDKEYPNYRAFEPGGKHRRVPGGIARDAPDV